MMSQRWGDWKSACIVLWQFVLCFLYHYDEIVDLTDEMVARHLSTFNGKTLYWGLLYLASSLTLTWPSLLENEMIYKTGTRRASEASMWRMVEEVGRSCSCCCMRKKNGIACDI